MEKKYTHGPWELFNVNGVLQVDNRDGDGTSPCVVHWRGFDGNDIDADENEANAHLISAAPDLLEALEGLLQAVCGETGFANAVRTESGLDYPWPALDIAESASRAAIRKAYGEGA